MWLRDLMTIAGKRGLSLNMLNMHAVLFADQKMPIHTGIFFLALGRLVELSAAPVSA